MTKFTVALLLAFCLSGCVPDHNFRPVTSTAGFAGPTQLQLSRSRSVGTLHFPAGVYDLYASDDSGWYYRARRSVIQHSWGGSVQYSGGLFVDRQGRERPRGYIIGDAGITKVGDIPQVAVVAPAVIPEPAAIPAEGPAPPDQPRDELQDGLR